MPKMKTKRSVAKRVRLTSNGKIKRWHAYKSHLKTKKNAKRKRNLRKADYVSKSDERRIKRALGL